MVPGAAARSVRDGARSASRRRQSRDRRLEGLREPVVDRFDFVEAEEPADVRRHVVEIAPVVLVDAEPRRMASHSRERDARRFLHDVAELTCQHELLAARHGRGTGSFVGCDRGVFGRACHARYAVRRCAG